MPVPRLPFNQLLKLAAQQGRTKDASFQDTLSGLVDKVKNKGSQALASTNRFLSDNAMHPGSGSNADLVKWLALTGGAGALGGAAFGGGYDDEGRKKSRSGAAIKGGLLGSLAGGAVAGGLRGLDYMRNNAPPWDKPRETATAIPAAAAAAVPAKGNDLFAQIRKQIKGRRDSALSDATTKAPNESMSYWNLLNPLAPVNAAYKSIRGHITSPDKGVGSTVSSGLAELGAIGGGGAAGALLLRALSKKLGPLGLVIAKRRGAMRPSNVFSGKTPKLPGPGNQGRQDLIASILGSSLGSTTGYNALNEYRMRRSMDELLPQQGREILPAGILRKLTQGDGDTISRQVQNMPTYMETLPSTYPLMQHLMLRYQGRN